jgi:hypothetical protein
MVSNCNLVNYSFCRESDITKERIEKILKAGANVVLTTKGIDDMSLKVCFHYSGSSGSDDVHDTLCL